MKYRRTARALLFNERDEIFLLRLYLHHRVGKPKIWMTPGGGIEPGETPQQALKRELYEELGMYVDEVGQPVYTRQYPIHRIDGAMTGADENYFYLRTDQREFRFENMTDYEKTITMDARWFSMDDVKQSGDIFFTEDLVGVMGDIIAGRLPEKTAVMPR